MKTLVTIAFLLAAPGALTFAAPPPAQPDDKPAADFKDDKEKASYGIGVIFGTQIKGGNMDVDVDTVISAMKEVLAGKTTKLTAVQAREAIGNYQRDQMTKTAEKNKKEFDSTAKYGTEPSKLAVNRVIKGWSEALEMMNVGSKWEIFLPAALAYADRPAGPDIGPGSTLIFRSEQSHQRMD